MATFKISSCYILSDISIRLEPTSINVRVGENITLVCLANAYCHSNLTLYWKAPFSPIENDTMRVNETSVTDTLKTTARVDYDGETIYCNVNSSDGIMKSVSVSLTVIGTYVKLHNVLATVSK